MSAANTTEKSVTSDNGDMKRGISLVHISLLLCICEQGTDNFITWVMSCNELDCSGIDGGPDGPRGSGPSEEQFALADRAFPVRMC